jgi:hypothetical protein
VDAHVDNQALIGAWNNERSKSRMLNSTLKERFQLTLDLDIALFISRVYNFAAGTANINEIQRPVNFCKSKTETVLLVLHSSRNAMIFFSLSGYCFHRFIFV